jgi:hypothetical protein
VLCPIGSQFCSLGKVVCDGGKFGASGKPNEWFFGFDVSQL